MNTLMLPEFKYYNCHCLRGCLLLYQISYIQYMNAALLAHNFVSNRDLAQRNATSKTEGLYVYICRRDLQRTPVIGRA